MKAQKRSGKIKLPSFAKNVKDLAVQKAITAGVVLVFALVVFMSVRAFLYGSGYFRLHVVETKSVFLDQKTTSSISNQILNLYKDRNIFRLNLRGISESIYDAYPDSKEIMVKVSLPDKLSINVKFRKPAALLKDSKLFAVDDEGVILPSVDAGPLKGLTIIEGIGARGDGRRMRPSAPRNLMLALALLTDIKGSNIASRYGVDIIDASKLTNLSFYLKNGVKIKIGCENFSKRLAMLESTLKDPRLILDKIKYIDVRFEEVVIGPKEG